MALNNIENQIKEKLNAREIQPSAPAWDRLDAMLSVAETKKTKRDFTWLYLAAAFLLFCGLGFFLLNSNESVAIENVIPLVTNEIIQEEIQKSQLPTEIKFITSEETVLVENSKLKNENIMINDENHVDSKNHVIADNISPITHHPSSNTYKYVSPENLLAEVEMKEKAIASDENKVLKPKIKVDANSLLTSVESELNEAHKETTLEKLSRKFQNAKSALANRNYE
jgi:hypothetical protein